MNSSDRFELSAWELAWVVHMLRRVAPPVRAEQDILLALIRKIEHELERIKNS